MYRLVRDRLARAGLPNLVFGSAAGAVYGWVRSPADVDVLVRCASPEPLLACIPEAVTIAPNGVQLGEVEIWIAPLALRFDHRTCSLPFDDEMMEHGVRHPVFGRVLGPEDQLLIKAVLQRSGRGKVDVEDAHTLVRHWGARLDRDYVARRAARCDVTDRVLPFLPEIAP